MRVVVVTGTSTDVGKTIATAALAVGAGASGSVVVVKAVQTGIGDGSAGDVDVVTALAGCAVEEWVRLDEPLAPDTAARRQGVAIPAVAEHASRVADLARSGAWDTVIVEGAGGLLVRLDADGGTLLDLASLLTETLPTGAVEVVVVTSAGLGTLNHTELTVGALRARDLEPAGLVIGSWPADPGLAETCNLDDLPRVTGLPVLGVLPAGAGSSSREEFAVVAESALTPGRAGRRRSPSVDRMSDEPALAGDLYEHHLEPHQHGRLRRTAVAAVDIVAASLGGLLELSSAGEVVVRRRADAVEVLRVPAGPPDEAAQVLAHVREQLTTLSPAEFRDTWGLPAH